MANLGRDQIILGYPWFQKFNPHFDWNTHTLKGDTVKIDTAGYQTKPSTSVTIRTYRPVFIYLFSVLILES